MANPPNGWKFDPFADVRLGKSMFQMRPEDWLVKDDKHSATPTKNKGNECG